MEKWLIKFSKRAEKDWKVVVKSEYKSKVMDLLELIETNPFVSPPSFKKLQGELQGAYSRRINHQHRLIYRLDQEKHIVNIIMMWLHYE